MYAYNEYTDGYHIRDACNGAAQKTVYPKLVDLRYAYHAELHLPPTSTWIATNEPDYEFVLGHCDATRR